MNWFSEDVKDIRAAHSTLRPTGAMRSAMTAPGSLDSAPRPAPLPLVHVKPQPHLEPNSTTDARARVREEGAPLQLRGKVPRIVAMIPMVLLASDLALLTVLGVVFPVGWALGLLFAALVVACRSAVRHYRPRLGLTVLDDVPRLIGSTLAAAGISLVVVVLSSADPADAGRLLQEALAFFVGSVVLQVIALSSARRLRRRGMRGRRALVVGEGRIAATLLEALAEHPELGLKPVSGAAPTSSPADATPARLFDSADVARLPEVIRSQRIDTAILALNEVEVNVDTIIDIHQTGCEILLVPAMFELHHDGPDVERVRGVPLLRLRPDPTLRVSWWIKRGMDVFVAGLGLLLLAPTLLVVAALILLESGRPVMFWQERVGLDGHTFRLCKFRSMRPRSEAESQTRWNIAGDPRVTRLGRFLRRSSIDEIPQLWNIICGQMSLVGPRPERPTFVEQFSQEHERYWARHRVPVGLTGLAQVNGLRGDTSIRERARFDNYYIANWTLWLDLKIMLLTAREVVGGRGR